MAKKKLVQDYLPGTEPVKNKKVHPKALHYAAMRDDRIAANVAEKEAHDTLLAAMLEEGLEDYQYGDLKVHVDNKKKCKVSTTPENAETNGESI
jgi:hypothetical protein